MLAILAAGCGEKKGSGPSVEAGARTFGMLCARCHGADGTGGVGQPPPRNFTDPSFQTARTDDELRHTVARGKGTAMPAFGAVLSPFEIESLIVYVRSLGR